ncbi:MAG TPA: YigZ family protein [Mogibacterium sp.]|nr:YigZ family protein [Mogibacterium sp.]
MILFRTAYESGKAEYVVEKSKFIAHVQPVESYEEARDFVNTIKNEYRDATHNVPAIICGDKQEIQWASDDGEPSGTSGLPMLKMIADEGLTNIAVVVTRYFGGIKLGTGGLARAYTAAAKLGLEAAGICEVLDSSVMIYTVEYSYLSKIKNLESGGVFEIIDIQYTENVTLTLQCLEEETKNVISIMSDLTSGKAILEKKEKDKIRVKIT